MRKTQLIHEYLERQKAKASAIQVNHVQAVIAQRLEANPQWGFKTLAHLERYIGLPRNAQCPLVRWTNRLPHGPENSFWCFPALFPALPTLVAKNIGGEAGPEWPFDEWARTVGMVADVERRYRKAIFYWSHADRDDPSWISRAIYEEFGKSLFCDVSPLAPYASNEEFESCN